MDLRYSLGQNRLFGNVLVCAALLAGTGISYGQNIQPVIDPALETRTTATQTTVENTAQNTTEPLLRPEPLPEIDTGRAVAQANRRAGVVEPGVAPLVEEDPFAPLGTQIGTLRLTTFVKQGVGFTTNKQSAALGDRGAFSRSEVDLQLRSQWERHELAINANGQYEDFFDRYIDPSPQVAIDGSLRLDLIDGFSATFGANYGFEKETASSTNLTTAAINEPGVHSFGTFAQLQRDARRFEMTLRASIDRTLYEDAKLAGGGLASQEDRNVTNHAMTMRLGYNPGLAFNPFIEAGITSAVHDLRLDRNGEQRDSLTYELRGGIEIAISEKISGEISLGFSRQEYSDPGLAALAGLVIDANVNWSPQRDTSIALTLGSDFTGSTTAGDSGAISYNGALAYTRRIRDNLEVTGSLGVDYTNFEGLNRIDTAYNAELGMEYWFNRTLSFTADLGYEYLQSSVQGNTYDAASVNLGIKVQR